MKTQRGMHRRAQNRLGIIHRFICLVGVVLSIYGNLDVDRNRILNVSYSIQPEKFFFITNSTLLLSTVSFVLAYFTQTSQNVRLKYVSRQLVTCTLCAEMMISLSFWPVFIYNPHLIFPSELIEEGPRQVSLFANLCMHAFPGILLFCIFVLDNITKYPIYKELAVYILFITGLSFAFYKKKGYWRYKILGNLPEPLVYALPLILFLLSCGVIWVIYRIKRKARESKIFKNIIQMSPRETIRD